MRAARASLAAVDVERFSAAVCASVLAMRAFATAAHVVVYAPMDKEIDPGTVALRARAAGKPVYYPAPTGDLEFLGGSSPAEDRRLSAPTASLLILVPGLAFDREGVRLGRGVGWYDRVLGRHPDAIRIGLAYDFQVVPALPRETWDVPMHAIVTEAQVLGDPFQVPAPMEENRS